MKPTPRRSCLTSQVASRESERPEEGGDGYGQATSGVQVTPFGLQDLRSVHPFPTLAVFPGCLGGSFLAPPHLVPGK